jgi:hypothetical protein
MARRDEAMNWTVMGVAAGGLLVGLVVAMRYLLA